MQKYAHEIKWGVLFTVAFLLWLYLEKLMGWHGPKIELHPTMTNIFAVVAIGIFVFGLLEKRRKLGGTMIWKQGFISGLLISVVVAVLAPLSQWLAHTVISPDYFPNIIAHSVENGLMSRADAERTFSLGSYMVQGVVGGLVMGVITSAVVAFFVRKKEMPAADL